MIRSSRERNRSCSPVSRRSRGRIAHPPSIISRARNHSLRFEVIAKTICKKAAAPPPNSGKNHYLERLNYPSRSTPWKYFTGDEFATPAEPNAKVAARRGEGPHVSLCPRGRHVGRLVI